MCLLDFIPQVVEIVKKLYSEGYLHTDVRKAVLIDLDNSVDVDNSVMICNISEQQFKDLTTFVYDLEKPIVEYFPDLKADNFLKSYARETKIIFIVYFKEVNKTSETHY